MNTEKLSKSEYGKGKIKGFYDAAHQLRNDALAPKDISIFDIAFNEKKDNKESFTTPTEAELKGTMDHLMDSLGINSQFDTISNILTVPDESIRWIVPEIVRAHIRLGLNRAPIYPNIIREEQSVSTPKVQMPFINQSDAAPRYVNEAETIQLGDVSYGSKELKIRKMGRGLRLTDEMRQYTSINLANIFFEDFGTRLGYALDGIAVDVLLNGEQANGSAASPVIGVQTVGTISYRDLLRVWTRMTRMGKVPNTMVGGEEAAMDILDLPEFKKSPNSAAPEARLNMQTPVPSSSNFYIHADVPDNQVVILDPNTTLIKFNARPLMIESERVVSNQTETSYATLTTGFAILFTDSRVTLDSTVDFETSKWPQYMNPDALAQETVKYK